MRLVTLRMVMRLEREIDGVIYKLRALLGDFSADVPLETERTALEAARLLTLGELGEAPDSLVKGSEFNWEKCYAVSAKVIEWERRRGVRIDRKERAILVSRVYRLGPGSPPPRPGAESTESLVGFQRAA